VRPELKVLLLLALAACGGEPTTRSANPRVRPKPPTVWGRDLAAGLGLAEHELCRELATVDCLAEAHLITLGGVEPTELGIDEPLANAAVSAPIAADRVASSACAERWRRDVAGPALLFGPVLEGSNHARREDVARTLVRRLLGRDAEQAELAALTDFYDVVAAHSDDATRDWGVGACVIVATSTEALFF
jgi:hypothetical protein